MDKTLVGENKPKVHQLHKGYSELYKEKIAIVLLSQPQQQHNVTQPQHSCWVGHENDFANPTLPTPPHRNFSGTSRRARELKFGTDTH